MINRSFYRVLTDIHNNFAVMDQPLVVNCTGHTFYIEEVTARSCRRDYYLIYLLNGSVTVTKPQVGRALRSGDLIVFSPGTPFCYFKPEGVEMEYYWVHFTGYLAPELLSQCGIPVNQIVTPGCDERVGACFDKLFDVFLTRSDRFGVQMLHGLSGILLELGRCLAEGGSAGERVRSRVSRALTYIHAHLGQPVSVRELAQAEHMSVSHFRAVFRESTGLSPQDYVTLAKLNFACELLRQTDMSVKQAAAAAGYTDPQYFSRVFCKHLGMPPGAYRLAGKLREE